MNHNRKRGYILIKMMQSIARKNVTPSKHVLLLITTSAPQNALALMNTRFASCLIKHQLMNLIQCFIKN